MFSTSTFVVYSIPRFCAGRIFLPTRIMKILSFARVSRKKKKKYYTSIQWKRRYRIEEKRLINNRSRDVMTHLHNALHPLERQVVIELHNIYIYIYTHIGNRCIPAINLAAFQHRDGLDRISFPEFNSFSTWKDLSFAGKHSAVILDRE